MSDKDDSEEKTLPPSQKKLRDARKKGQVARSRDIVMGVALTLFFLLSYLFMGDFLRSFQNALVSLEHPEGREFLSFSYSVIAAFFVNLGAYFFVLMAVLIGASVATNVAVLKGFLFSLDAVKPNPDNLNPANGFKQIFSIRSLVELIKNVVKASAFFIIAYFIIVFGLKSIFYVPLCGSGCEMTVFVNIMGAMVAAASLILLATGLLDINLQNWLFNRKLRMSKSEMKRELKDQEGSPEIKGSRRRVWRSNLSPRQSYTAEDATLVIMGDNSVAALRYVSGETPVPILVAKGRGDSADRILAATSTARIPAARDEDLASGIYQTTEIGAFVAEQHFDAIARAMTRAR